MATLTDHDDRVKLWGFWLCLGLIIAIGFIVLQLALVTSPSSAEVPRAPAVANPAAGAPLDGARR